MSIDFKCVNHSDKSAAGDCSRCQMPYCSDCLDMEMGQPLCVACKKNFMGDKSEGANPPEEKLGMHVDTPPPLPAATPAPPAPKAPATSPLNFKGRGLEDDPLGLLSGPPKNQTPKPVISPPPAGPVQEASVPIPNLDLPKNNPRPPTPNPSPNISTIPSVAGTPKPSLDLDSLISDPQAPRPPFPKAPAGAPTLSLGPSVPFPVDANAGISGVPQKKKNKIISLTKVWSKYLIRRSYEMFDPLAQKIHVPTYAFLAILATLLGALVFGAGVLLNRPSVVIVETIPQIHFIRVNSNQISEMDVTTYGEFQNQIQTMGFTPLIQMTVPQLPSPNFFDVGIKDNIGTYSEILKMKGSITPQLSFVTVFTNGIWFSTNGWEGDSHEMDYLMSRFYPKETPDQLYVKHVQAVEKLKQDNGWQVQSMNENRYMAALSDHLRWFLTKKGMQGYNANFGMWH